MNDGQGITDSKSTLLFQLEKDIATLLLTKLEHFDLSFERASLIARFILSHLPEDITDEQLEKIIPSLDDEFVELAGIVNKYMLEFEEKNSEALTQEISELVKNKGAGIQIVACKV
ncbi:hypothetical protein A3D00_00820 [Candidatus Woesebacteria bacterium RIFCSPHIGHO2_02_FULL_38_9]|uniref:Uncharacterized protein n=1 Tax=Candidatus Woesebacteria bacterium RIFCSPHIGHO2_01_FULL_39_28 TaxID=1802496 RepID=A0A1F7Y982_9BACT|nr:MAG: hypothetical protein A2627_02145 [Candidatus Woesebacteria bacterium RIFCSPHIGHO2_01_FULL_39_28]OGM33444.1 MAG: hypothetical protein A3D00_00820 [Candidatus Woesebacteria bacterium RIFCSPHIGHO2_02_FULL_38_9]OGM57270.1 MAG: hypothetical protein A3A50_00620 [Candidatus Woesebacteria bacterium RIFCSPLOWO2_01_FULL_38_20]